MNNRATFKRMQDSTREDWDIIKPQAAEFFSGLPERVMAHLQLLVGDFSGFPIDRYTHCLQTATLALKDGRDEEYVVCALLHDIGDTLGCYNHPEVAAAILKPFISEENLWMIEHHGIFQGHNFFHHIGMERDMREQFKDHPCYARTVEFIDKYDSPAFDPDTETYSLSIFEPMLRRVIAAPKRSLYKSITQRPSAGIQQGAGDAVSSI
jgi:predicted HD phosphohydrolase